MMNVVLSCNVFNVVSAFVCANARKIVGVKLTLFGDWRKLRPKQPPESVRQLAKNSSEISYWQRKRNSRGFLVSEHFHSVVSFERGARLMKIFAKCKNF